jgi:hypothetical protein
MQISVDLLDELFASRHSDHRQFTVIIVVHPKNGPFPGRSFQPRNTFFSERPHVFPEPQRSVCLLLLYHIRGCFARDSFIFIGFLSNSPESGFRRRAHRFFSDLLLTKRGFCDMIQTNSE